MRMHLKGFTLLELMVVITIIGIISLASYMPYAHHQKKVALKTAAREISQSLSSARNLAINGLDTGSGNLHVGLFFASGAEKISLYTSTGALTLSNLPYADIYSEKKFPLGVRVDSIDSTSGDVLFVFDAISGSGSIFGASLNSVIPIQISYKGAASPVLQHEIRYYAKSYISDY